MGGLGDHEDLVVINLDFRNLLYIEGVLDREGMQAKGLLQGRHFLVCRVMKTDPGKLARGFDRLRIAEGHGVDPLAVAIKVRSHNTHGQSSNPSSA